MILLLLVMAAGLQAQESCAKVFQANDGTKNASISALVINAKTGKVVDQFNKDLVLAPASCTKLLTTCTALELLGSDFCFPTTLEIRGQKSKVEGQRSEPVEGDLISAGGVIDGDLFIHGTGDPTLGSRDLGDRAFLGRWVNALKRQGVTRIKGDIVADMSFMDNEATNPTWQWEDMGNYYAPGISAIAYLDNTMVINLKSTEIGKPVTIVSTNPEYPDIVFENYIRGAGINYDGAVVNGVPFSNTRFLRGSIPANKEVFGLKGDLPNPGLLLAHHLRAALLDSGIVVDGSASYTFEPDSLKHVVLHKHLSEPLSEIVKVTNIDSNNLFAESVFRHLGSKMGTPATIDNSIEIERSCWANRGVNLQTAIIHDGCGLSTNNAISASQFVSLLTYMYKKSKNLDALYASLPVSGESGTLKGLLRKTPLQGRVHAKSGTISHVRSYAGYIESAGGETYIFAILVNKASCKSRVTREMIEKYLLAVYEKIGQEEATH